MKLSLRVLQPDSTKSSFIASHIDFDDFGFDNPFDQDIRVFFVYMYYTENSGENVTKTA